MKIEGIQKSLQFSTLYMGALIGQRKVYDKIVVAVFFHHFQPHFHHFQLFSTALSPFSTAFSQFSTALAPFSIALSPFALPAAPGGFGDSGRGARGPHKIVPPPVRIRPPPRARSIGHVEFGPLAPSPTTLDRVGNFFKKKHFDHPLGSGRPPRTNYFVVKL